MCNLYSITKGQAAIIAWTRAMRDTMGNLPSFPGGFTRPTPRPFRHSERQAPARSDGFDRERAAAAGETK